MRNGLNISGVSELVHELRQKPREAIIDFNAEAALHHGAFEARVEAINAGTIRIARDFRTFVQSYAKDGLPDPTPQELLMIALGGCVMVTYVQGCSAKGVTITSLSIEAAGDIPALQEAAGSPGSWKMRNLRYKVSFDCEGSDEALREIAQQVACYSPNHRTFIEAGEMACRLEVGGQTGLVPDSASRRDNALAQPSLARGATVVGTLNWKYGTQIEARTWTQKDSLERPAGRRLEVDQPKQVGGIDCAPNPQEYLLWALASDLLLNLASLAKSEGKDPGMLRVEATGRLDFRGILNVDPSVPVRIHGIGFRIHVEGDGGDYGAWSALATRALASSLCYQTIKEANSIRIVLQRDGTALLEMDSTLETSLQFLKALMEKAALASARAQ